MTVKADLDALRAMIGAQGTKDDALLGVSLESAGAWVYDRVCTRYVHAPEVQQAVLLLAARLYKRRNSPEGVAGWDDLGAIRIIARDPDIERLIEQYIDAAKVLGIA